MPANKHGHHWIRNDKRKRIHERDGWRCAWCFADLRGDGAQGVRTLDHVVPRSRGGDNAASNLVTACGGCNLERGEKDLVESCALFASRIAYYRRLSQTERIEIGAAILTRVQDFRNRPLPPVKRAPRRRPGDDRAIELGA
jgi:hypothetical protein